MPAWLTTSFFSSFQWVLFCWFLPMPSSLHLFFFLISVTLDKEVYLSLCQSSHDRVALFYLWWRVALVFSVRFPRSPWVLASSWQTGEEWAQEHLGGSFYGPDLEVQRWHLSLPLTFCLLVLETEQNKIRLSTQKLFPPCLYLPLLSIAILLFTAKILEQE